MQQVNAQLDKAITLARELGLAISQIDGISEEAFMAIGGNAINIIGDYPLYSSGSNIGYVDAIAIATVLGYGKRDLLFNVKAES